MAKKATKRIPVNYETATFVIEGPNQFHEHVSSLVRAERIAEDFVKALLERGTTYGYVNIEATDADGNWEVYRNYDLSKLSLRNRPLEPGQVRILKKFHAVLLADHSADQTTEMVEGAVYRVAEYWLNAYKVELSRGRFAIVPADKAEAGEKPAVKPVILTKPTPKALPEQAAPVAKTDDDKKAARRARRLARKAASSAQEAQEAPLEKVAEGLDPDEAKKAAKRARAKARRERRKAEQAK